MVYTIRYHFLFVNETGTGDALAAIFPLTILSGDFIMNTVHFEGVYFY